MAQYTDNDGVSPGGRTFVISAPRARVIGPGGVITDLAHRGDVANIPAVDVPFASLTAAAEAHNALLAALKAGGIMVDD